MLASFLHFYFRGALVVNKVSNKDACGACHTHTQKKNTLLNEPESSSAKSSCGKKINQMAVSRHKNKGITKTFTRYSLMHQRYDTKDKCR